MLPRNLVLAAVLATSLQCAEAQTRIIEITPGSSYKRTTSVTENGVTRTTTETSTTPGVIKEVAGGDIFLTTLGSRRVILENAIAAGQAAGTLSAVDASRLRAELDAVSRAEAANQGKAMTYATALPLAMILDHVGSSVHGLMPEVIYQPLVSSGRFVLSDTYIIKLDDVVVRRAELESRIAQELAQGKLTATDANLLRGELNKIAVVEAPMRARGELTYKDTRELYRRFDRVGSRLDSLTRKRR